MELFHRMISGLLGISERQISSTLHLLDEGTTILFISRCRKEATGGLGEVRIENIKEQHSKLCDITKRKETILSTIDEQGKLTPELEKRISATWDPTESEDVYLPYKLKRKTHARATRRKGLEPLAVIMMLQREPNLTAKAVTLVKDDVKDTEGALKGARDIIAEQVNESECARNAIRNQLIRQAEITAKIVKEREEEAIKYRDYFDFSESLKRCTPHRLLAIRRTESEGLLKISISPDDEACLERLDRQLVRGNNECSHQIKKATADVYKRLPGPSIETEFTAQSRRKADDETIRVFTENLHQLLLSPPPGQKRVSTIDPGFHTGCKVVCLDTRGNLLHNGSIYPHPPISKTGRAASELREMIEACEIEAISIGSGTASRKAEDFINHRTFGRQTPIFVVNRQGASAYSASEVARDEFPDYDVTVRGAASIGRRLMDSLAELVKIDPKSIGVGQYQHDIDQTKLKEALNQTVENCVDLIGVSLNTASSHLLTCISGLGLQLAQNVASFRAESGAFSSRKELMKVPRMDAKAFEQCAGFLHIPGAKNPSDSTAVHPESYHIVKQMVKDLECSVDELIANKELRQKIKTSDYITPTVGPPTLQDIMQELGKPGRDPRKAIKVFEFDKNAHTIADLRKGMILPNIVGNITNFGAFVNISIKESGLVHLSQLAERYISDSTKIVSIHQHVMIGVMNVDTDRKWIQLSMIGVQQD